MKKYLLILSVLIFIGAVYPVRHAAGLTFGYESIGASSGGAGDAQIYASGKGAPISNGTVTMITSYFSTGSGVTSIDAGLYQDSAGVPSAIVGTEYRNSGQASLAAGWHNLTTNSLSVVNGTTYWNAMNVGAGSAAITQYYDVTTGTQRAWDTHTIGVAWPATFTVNSSSAAKYSIYATYSASNGGAVVEDPPQIIIVD